MAKRLAIDFEDVQMAFQDREGAGQWFLHTETGEVIRLTEDDDETELDERYIGIPYQGSEPAYRDMAEFIASLSDNRLRGLLDVAIRGQGAFRRFKDVLLDHPAERDRWFAFQKECVHRRIRRWLETEGIEAVFAPASGN